MRALTRRYARKRIGTHKSKPNCADGIVHAILWTNIRLVGCNTRFYDRFTLQGAKGQIDQPSLAINALEHHKTIRKLSLVSEISYKILNKYRKI